MLTSNNMVRTVLWICNLKRLGYDYEILTFLRMRSPFGYIEAPLLDLCNSLQMGGKEIPFWVSFVFPCGTDGIPFRMRIFFFFCLIYIFVFFFYLFLCFLYF